MSEPLPYPPTRCWAVPRQLESMRERPFQCEATLRGRPTAGSRASVVIPDTFYDDLVAAQFNLSAEARALRSLKDFWQDLSRQRKSMVSSILQQWRAAREEHRSECEALRSEIVLLRQQVRQLRDDLQERDRALTRIRRVLTDLVSP